VIVSRNPASSRSVLPYMPKVSVAHEDRSRLLIDESKRLLDRSQKIIDDETARQFEQATAQRKRNRSPRA
jgi:hypothetical protein